MSTLLRHLRYLLLTLALSTFAAEKGADLSRLVVIGDSLAAGYTNGSLHETQQPHGFASLIATQAQVPLTLPLIAAPGVPNVLQLVSPGPPPIIQPAPGTSTGRSNFDQPANLAVPGHSVQDALATRPDLPFDSMTDLVLGLPGLLAGESRTQVEWAEALSPTTIIIWIGSNNVLQPAIAGGTAGLTPEDEFETAFLQLISRLAATKASLVVANIPDIAATPYFLSLTDLQQFTGAPAAALGAALGVTAADSVILDAFPLVYEILTGAKPGPLPPTAVITAAEMATLQNAVKAYNKIIEKHARAHNAAIVDIYKLTTQIDKHGYQVDTQTLTTNYLGGIFSLDGIHPTYTGHAILANEFIEEINKSFKLDIPMVLVPEIAATDPLLF